MDEDKQKENSHVDQKLHVRLNLTEIGKGAVQGSCTKLKMTYNTLNG